MEATMKVLVSDTLSPEGIQILKNAPGLEVDVITNLTPDELKGVIGDYDGSGYPQRNESYSGDNRQG